MPSREGEIVIVAITKHNGWTLESTALSSDEVDMCSEDPEECRDLVQALKDSVAELRNEMKGSKDG